MYKRKGFFLMLLLIMAGLVWGSAQALAAQSPSTKNKGNSQQNITLKDAQKAAAAIKKSKGRMQYTINDDRWAAAQRTADRRAASAAKGKGGSK